MTPFRLCLTTESHPLCGKCLCLKALGDKASITLLKVLILVIEAYGKPKVIRTDDGSVQAMPGYSPGILERG